MLAELDDSQAVRENCVVWNELSASAVFDEELRRRVDEVNLTWTQTTASFIEARRLTDRSDRTSTHSRKPRW
jgi:hypothetical protein